MTVSCQYPRIHLPSLAEPCTSTMISLLIFQNWLSYVERKHFIIGARALLCQCATDPEKGLDPVSRPSSADLERGQVELSGRV